MVTMSEGGSQVHIASSSSGGSFSNGTQPVRNPPNCGNCRNHGILVPLRGHKRKCVNRDCGCEQCNLTIRRREVMAMQTALQRKRRMEEKLQGGSVTEKAPIETIPVFSPSLKRRSLSVPSPPSSSTSPPTDEMKDHSHAVMTLINTFHLDMNALPFAYAVLRIAAGDIHNATELVKRAEKELFPTRITHHSNLPQLPTSIPILPAEPDYPFRIYPGLDGNSPLSLVTAPRRSHLSRYDDSDYRSYSHSVSSISSHLRDRLYNRLSPEGL